MSLLNSNLVNLDNLQPNDIEQEPELTENLERREAHIQNILETKQQEMQIII